MHSPHLAKSQLFLSFPNLQPFPTAADSFQERFTSLGTLCWEIGEVLKKRTVFSLNSDENHVSEACPYADDFGIPRALKESQMKKATLTLGPCGPEASCYPEKAFGPCLRLADFSFLITLGFFLELSCLVHGAVGPLLWRDLLDGVHMECRVGTPKSDLFHFCTSCSWVPLEVGKGSPSIALPHPPGYLQISRCWMLRGAGQEVLSH